MWCIAYGLTFAHSQKWPTLAERDYERDKIFALCVGLSGIIGLIIVLYINGIRHGLKFK